MIRLAILLASVIFASSALGVFINKRIPLPDKYYKTPFGFAAFIALLQLLYYPSEWWNLSSDYEHLMTLTVLAVTILYGLCHVKEIIKEYKRLPTLWIVLSFAVFVFVFYHCSIDIAHSDSQMYLNYIAQNIDNPTINNFNLWTGETGKEWDTIYLFQGYYHFGSSLCYMVNANHYLYGSAMVLDNITISTWGLGSLYALISAMWMINFASFLSKEKWIKIVILLFGLFYLNFFYWRVAFSFYGNTFRTITSSALLFTLALSFKEKRYDYKYLCMILSFSGLAFSSSYLFISFAVYYALMVYLFTHMRRNAIREMADHVLPLLIYALSCFYKDHFFVFVVGILLAILYFLLRNKPFFIKITDCAEGFFYRYGKIIFIYGAFLLLATSAALYCLVINPHYEYGYAAYFYNHQLYDMIKDFFFVYTGKSQNLVNLIRWTGVALLLVKKSDGNEEMSFLKNVFIVLFVCFLNPLVTPMIAKTIASNVFYRTFDVVFNPYTEMMFLAMICREIKGKARLVPVLLTLYLIVYAHGFSLMNEYTGEYGYYIHDSVLPKYKITNETLKVIRALQDELEGKDNVPQIRIVSHAEGVRSFLPELYNVFTTYQVYYPNTRINEEFFQQARNHYTYESYPETDFSSACNYLNRFEISYVIIEYNQNVDYDIEVGKCAQLLYQNDVFKLYRYQ